MFVLSNYLCSNMRIEKVCQDLSPGPRLASREDSNGGGVNSGVRGLPVRLNPKARLHTGRKAARRELSVSELLMRLLGWGRVCGENDDVWKMNHYRHRVSYGPVRRPSLF